MIKLEGDSKSVLHREYGDKCSRLVQETADIQAGPLYRIYLQGTGASAVVGS